MYNDVEVEYEEMPGWKENIQNVQNLIPEANIIKRQRFSELSYRGKNKISRIF